ncbi:translation initiation factor IF-2-like [Monodelphis domestica]|uniref:translation initiation factor IF-2-like n=1 Tax=Monodelphis domestica TaxID=13616 RepID=UPI0024E250F8|nr:translation initiation factor IF-2-like [Monodelphis domestica]XP_056674107.1 translation initiation factor IF-2-like [Monodelphis domestica]
MAAAAGGGSRSSALLPSPSVRSGLRRLRPWGGVTRFFSRRRRRHRHQRRHRRRPRRESSSSPSLLGAPPLPSLPPRPGPAGPAAPAPARARGPRYLCLARPLGGTSAGERQPSALPPPPRPRHWPLLPGGGEGKGREGEERDGTRSCRRCCRHGARPGEAARGEGSAPRQDPPLRPPPAAAAPAPAPSLPLSPPAPPPPKKRKTPHTVALPREREQRLLEWSGSPSSPVTVDSATGARSFPQPHGGGADTMAGKGGGGLRASSARPSLRAAGSRGWLPEMGAASAPGTRPFPRLRAPAGGGGPRGRAKSWVTLGMSLPPLWASVSSPVK